MSGRFSISAEWLNSDLDDPAEAETMAEVSVAVDDNVLSRISETETGEISEGTRLPAIVLAEGLVRRWWQILYEPQRTKDRAPRENFESRHRLDALTPGYVFPPIGIWSGGETVMVGLFKTDLRFQNQSFLLPSGFKPQSIERGSLQDRLSEFVQATIQNLSSSNLRAMELKEDWERVVSSLDDPDELEWCKNAGRLGLDPYEPDRLDLGSLRSGITDNLFSDICEAVDSNEIVIACDWARSATARMKFAKSISVKNFKAAPYRNLSLPGYKNGLEAVQSLRQTLGLPLDPKQALDALFNDFDMGEGERELRAPPSLVEGMARREGSEVKVNVSARSIKQKRFRVCRAAYLGWRSGSDTDVAITPAETWRQQASRAFAAELLAPAKLLRDRFGKTGLNKVNVERLSAEWLCPPLTIVHQANHEGIPVRGAENAAVF